MAGAHRYLYWAQLKVDKTAADRAPSGYSLCVLEAGLEGLAAPLLLDMEPRVYKVRAVAWLPRCCWAWRLARLSFVLQPGCPAAAAVHGASHAFGSKQLHGASLSP